MIRQHGYYYLDFLTERLVLSNFLLKISLTSLVII